MDACLSWWDCSLDEIAGVPAFWVARAARVIQFLSGLVIVIEIVGRDRVEGARKPTIQLLDAIVDAQLLRRVGTGLWETSKYFVLYQLAPWGSEKERYYLDLSNAAKYDTQAIVAWLGLTVLGMVGLWATIFSLWQDELGLHSLWIFPLSFIGLFMASGIFVYIVALPMALLLMHILVRPLKWALDRGLRLISKVLERQGIARTILAVSLILFVLAFFMEIAAS